MVRKSVATFRGILWRDRGLLGCILLVPLLLSVEYAQAQEGWTQVPGSVPWDPRTGQGVVVHDDKIWLMGGRRDHVAQSTRNDVWSSEDGATWELVLEEAPWSPRARLGVASFKGRLWVAGGVNSEFSGIGDLWSTKDGVTWKEMPIPPWFDVEGRKIVVFQDKLWALGGDTRGHPQLPNDMWYTEDGETWVEATDEVPWAYRKDFVVEVFDDKLWVMGGETYGGQRSNEAWFSEDGFRWHQTEIPVAWSERSGAGSAVFDGRLWIFGGESKRDPGVGNVRSTQESNDVWATSDGRSWEPVANAPWEARQRHSTVVFDDRIWVIGGKTSVIEHNDVWSTRDGINWTSPFEQRFSKRSRHATVSHDGYLWVMGGYEYWNGDQRRCRDVWKSKDGANWSLVTDTAPWRSLTASKAISFNGKIWLIGGFFGREGKAIFWSSVDGVEWLAEDEPPWTNRIQHAVVVHDNKLWILGGSGRSESNDGLLYDVWYSEDGSHWTEATSGAGAEGKGLAALGHRYNHACFSLDGKLWLVGGAQEPDVNGDIWWTKDGANWTKAVDEAPFGTLGGHQTLRVNDEVLVLGGANPWSDRGGDGNYVWGSRDGIKWYRYSDENTWGRFENAEAVALDGKVWTLGAISRRGNFSNSVWTFNPSPAKAGPIAAEPIKPKLQAAHIRAEVNLDWSGELGADWTTVEPIAETPYQLSTSAFVYEGELWLQSWGVNYWRSSDAIAWRKAPGIAPSPAEKEYEIERRDFEGKLYTDTVTPRPNGQIVFQGDTTWLVSETRYGDGAVWKSTGNQPWSLVKLETPWSTRLGRTVAFDGKLWHFGGKQTPNSNKLGEYSGEVWSSTDGADWEMLTTKAPWERKWGYRVFVFHNQLWALGPGVDSIWVSNDGIQWDHVEQQAETQPLIKSGSIFPIGDRLWMVGELSSPMKSVWSSPDGVRWEKEVESISLPSRQHFEGVEYQGRTWFVSRDLDREDSYPNSGLGLWSFDESMNWRKHEFAMPWSREGTSVAATHGDRLLVMAQEFSYEPQPITQVYASADGANWALLSDAPPWGQRDDMTVVSHANRLWLIGGYRGSEESGTWFNDVWSSEDGANWELTTDSAGWSPRRNVQCVSFNGQLMLFGGQDGDSRFSDVWASTDGIFWELKTDNLPFRVPFSKSMVEFAGKLWVLGVQTPKPGSRIWTSTDGVSRIWNSADGVTWQVVETDETWSPQGKTAAIVHGGRMWVTSGDSDYTGDDDAETTSSMRLQYSTDGKTWTTVSDKLTGDSFTNTLLSAGGRLWSLDTSTRTVSFSGKPSG